MSSISGAGAIIFDGNDLILVRDIKTKEYTDLGGNLQNNSTWSTAAHEVYEESKKLIDLTKLGINQLNMSSVIINANNNSNYKCYIIKNIKI